MLDLAGELDPSKVIKKLKYHILVHMREDIKRFGPLIGMITESYESFNSVFRACSVLSNHQAPSRNIAHQLAQQEMLKHIISGGHWLSESTGKWTQSSQSVRSFISSNKTLRSLYGWPEPSSSMSASGESFVKFTPNYSCHLYLVCLGSVRLAPQKKNEQSGRKEYLRLSWNQTQGVKAVNQQSEWATASWHNCKSVVSQH